MTQDIYGVDPERPTHNPAVRSANAQGHVDPAMEFVPDATQPAAAAAYLRTPNAIRTRAAALLARARRGESAWFRVGDANALEDAAREVAEVTRDRYDWGPIPYHSLWRHFEAGGVDRLAQLDALLEGNSSHMALNPTPVRELSPPMAPTPVAWVNKTGSTNGFGAYVAFVPSKQMGIVLLANRNYAMDERIRAAHHILTTLDGARP